MSVDYRHTVWFFGPTADVERLAAQLAYQPGDSRAMEATLTQQHSLSAHQALDFERHKAQRLEQAAAWFGLPSWLTLSAQDVAFWYARHHAPTQPLAPRDDDVLTWSSFRLARFLMPDATPPEQAEGRAYVWERVREDFSSMHGVIAALPNGWSVLEATSPWVRRDLPCTVGAVDHGDPSVLGNLVLVEGVINDSTHDYEFGTLTVQHGHRVLGTARHACVDEEGFTPNHAHRRTFQRADLPSVAIDWILRSTAAQDREAYATLLRNRRAIPLDQRLNPSGLADGDDGDDIPF